VGDAARWPAEGDEDEGGNSGFTRSIDQIQLAEMIDGFDGVTGLGGSVEDPLR
jgi:hypothetical protein